MNQEKETLAKWIFCLAACTSVVAVLAICFFLFAEGLPAIGEIGVKEFLLGMKWKPSNNYFGIFPMIIGSLMVTAGALIVGVPIGILAAVFLAFYCPKKWYTPIKAMTELMAGIPSVVYGFFGLVVMVPLVREYIDGKGYSVLTASLLLGIMILPTIIGVSQAAMEAVPKKYAEGALALGATKERSLFFAALPAAKSGILAGVVLGIGRALGETMAVVMVAGNQPQIAKSILSGTRTLTSNIILEMGYAADLHREALIATGVVLFIFILIINGVFAVLKERGGHEK